MRYNISVPLASRSIALSVVLLAQSAPAIAGYGDMPTQPGDPGYVPPPPMIDEPTTQASKPSPIDWELVAAADYLSAPIRGGTNPFGFGLGGRFGFTVHGFYAGVTLVDYFGGADVTLSDQALLVGGEAGYGFVLHDFERLHVSLVLRPILGVGNATVSHTDPSIVQNAKPDVVTTASGRTVSGGGAPSPTISVNNVYLRPKLALLLMHRWLLVAIEGDGLLVPGISYGGADPSLWISYGAQVQVGARF
jgi:hypothetical protein